jgi:cell division protein FtsB
MDSRRNYILAGNYLMLDALYAEKAALVRELDELRRKSSAQARAIETLKRIAGKDAVDAYVNRFQGGKVSLPS